MQTVKVLLCLLCTLGLPEVIYGDIWAVLVAGSRGWSNYRHQADVAHAYQILRANGIPPEHIITMMYDDVAHHKENPFDGELFHDYGHQNVYKGIHIDYKGDDVTPETFVGVLLGDELLKIRGRKVLQSGPDDNVFIYFSDHGDPNLLVFPDDVLYADSLAETLSEMHSRGLYGKMVIYVEACFAGSMFMGLLPSDTKVHVLTASNATERSYAIFCDDEIINTCLGNEFSYHWMNISDMMNSWPSLEREPPWTLGMQSAVLKAAVKYSHVTKFGDQSMDSCLLSEFIGKKGRTNSPHFYAGPTDLVPSQGAYLVPLYHKIGNAKTEAERRLLNLELARKRQHIELVDTTFAYIEEATKRNSVITGVSSRERTPFELVKCFRAIHESFSEHCYSTPHTPEVFPHLVKFQNLCKDGVDPEVVIDAIEKICDEN
ncbi:unnamed protein product [Calicophoron daubneyi]|uniref:Hemoglobinase n=1 Tax=Calicophoron daubneyi TaxID=300641 RepID=A0AAV2TFF4_CALDB